MRRWCVLSLPPLLLPRLQTEAKVSSLIPQPCRSSQALITLPPSRCCSTLCHRDTSKVKNPLQHFILFFSRFYSSGLDFYLCAGLLGAAPAMPLLTNPALSAALLQVLLQNQAKAQQVPTPFRPLPSTCFLPAVTSSWFFFFYSSSTCFLAALCSVPPLASFSGESASLGSGAAQ